MTYPRAALLKTVATLRAFDLSAIPSPCVGLQWGEHGPLFHRTSPNGIIESVGYRREPPALIISLQHLKESLVNLQDDEIDLSNQGSLLTLRTTKGYMTELKVHTLKPDHPWRQTHMIGKPIKDLPKDGFNGIKSDGFPLVCQPVLRKSKLMFATDFGIIFKDNIPVDGVPSPRAAFLRAIASHSVDKLFITDTNYWAAIGNEFRVIVSGHKSGEALFASYDVAVNSIAELPASRLVHALSAASNLADVRSRILFDPSLGIVVRDQFEHDNQYSLGDVKGWNKFSVLPRTAEVLSEVFTQVKDETIHLAQIDDTTMRMQRGPWSVSFKVFQENRK